MFCFVFLQNVQTFSIRPQLVLSRYCDTVYSVVVVAQHCYYIHIDYYFA